MKIGKTFALFLLAALTQMNMIVTGSAAEDNTPGRAGFVRYYWSESGGTSDDLEPGGEDSGEENVPALSGASEPVTGGVLPGSYMTKKLPPLRKQTGNSCWSFATNGLAELYAINHPETCPTFDVMGTVSSDGVYYKAEDGEDIPEDAEYVIYDVDMAEAHTCYFTYNTPTDPLGGTAGDQNGFKNKAKDCISFGGNVEYSRSVLMGRVGAADESIAPMSNSSQILSEGLSGELAYEDQLHMTGGKKINIQEDRELVKEAIMENGGVGVSIYIGSSYYNGTNNCFYNYSSPGKTNHAVILVGWDDDFPAESFNRKPAEDGAWIVRNSYDSSKPFAWGYDRYFYLSYADTSIGKAAYTFEYETAGKTGNCYQYDGGMVTGSIAYENLAGANVFTAKAGQDGELIKSISFETENTEEEYRVEIYTGLTDPMDPTSGFLMRDAVTEGNTSFVGFYTVELESPVYVKSGDTFSVVVRLSKGDEECSLGVENNSVDEVKYLGGEKLSVWSNYYSHCAVNPGESFFYDGDEDSWYDITEIITYDDGDLYGGNVRIKAYTDNVSAEEVPEAAQAVRCKAAEEERTLTSGGALQLSPEAYPASDAVFSYESSDESVATVDESGLVKAIGPGVAVIKVLSGDAWDEIIITVESSGESGGDPGGDGDEEEDKDKDEDGGEDKDKDKDEDGGKDKDKDPVPETIVTLVSANEAPEGGFRITYDLLTDIRGVGNLPTVTGYVPSKGMKAISLPKPTRAGYIFKGWHLSFPSGKKISKIVKKYRGDIYLVAEWKSVTYTVSFKKDAKEVGGKILPIKRVAYDNAITLPTGGFVKNGYTLAGFARHPGAEAAEFSLGEQVKNLSAKQGGKVVLYPVWVKAES